MVSTRKKKQSNRRLFSQLDDFDQESIIGNAASDKQENVVVNEGTVDQELTVKNTHGNLTANQILVNVKTIERCFNTRIDREMGTIVDTVEDRIQNAILTTIESFISPKPELAVRSINAFSGQDVTSVTANWERGELIGITASFENVSERNYTLHGLYTNDEARNKITDEVSELSIPGTQFDRQPHTHHTNVNSIDKFENSSWAKSRIFLEEINKNLKGNYSVSSFLSGVGRTIRLLF